MYNCTNSSEQSILSNLISISLLVLAFQCNSCCFRCHVDMLSADSALNHGDRYHEKSKTPCCPLCHHVCMSYRFIRSDDGNYFQHILGLTPPPFFIISRPAHFLFSMFQRLLVPGPFIDRIFLRSSVCDVQSNVDIIRYLC